MMEATQNPVRFVRRQEILLRTGYSNSTLYDRIGKGLFTRGVSLGGQVVGWPSDELSAINSARIAGKTDDEIRDLVDQLHAARAAHRCPTIHTSD